MSKRTRSWIQVGIAAGLIVAALLFFDLGEMAALLASISIPMFLASLAAAAADQTLMGLKWNLLLKTFGIHVPTRVPVASYWRGRFLKFVAPSTLGLDAYRAYYVKKHGCGEDQSLVPILSSIFVERFLGLLSSLAMIALMFPFGMRGLGLHVAVWVWPLAAAAFVGVWGLVWVAMRYSHLPGRRERVPLVPKRLQKPVLAFLKALSMVKQDSRRVYLYFAVSNFEKLGYATCLWFAAKAVGIHDVGWFYCVAAIPIVALLERLPISVSGIGLREGMYVVILRPYGIAASHAVTVGLVVRLVEIVLILLSLFSWIPGMRRGNLKSRLKDIAQETA